MVCSDIGSFKSIVNVHEIMIITVSDLLEVPRSHILQLKWNLVPAACVGQPLQWRSSIICINFKRVEHWPKRQSDPKNNFPKLNPFSYFCVLIDDLAFFKVNGRVRIHGGSLYKWLELVTRMRRGHFNAHDLFKRGASKDGVSKSGSHMRKLLGVIPFNFSVTVMLIVRVVVVMFGKEVFLVFKLFKFSLVVNFLGLRFPFRSWFAPTMIEISKFVV